LRVNPVAARSENQRRYLEMLEKNALVFGIGPAGTGKTYLAVAAALRALRAGQVKRIVITRPVVEAGEHLGFLPGDLQAKLNPYTRPIYDAFYDLLGFEDVLRFEEQGVIEVAPLAFMRGRTLSHAFAILDEGQNTTVPQMKMFLTRLGENSRMVVTGDPSQTDLDARDRSGLLDAVNRLRGFQDVGVTSSSARTSCATRWSSRSCVPTRVRRARRAKATAARTSARRARAAIRSSAAARRAKRSATRARARAIRASIRGTASARPASRPARAAGATATCTDRDRARTPAGAQGRDRATVRDAPRAIRARTPARLVRPGPGALDRRTAFLSDARIRRRHAPRWRPAGGPISSCPWSSCATGSSTRMHADWLGDPSPTDVLSFDLGDAARSSRASNARGARRGNAAWSPAASCPCTSCTAFSTCAGTTTGRSPIAHACARRTRRSRVAGMGRRPRAARRSSAPAWCRLLIALRE
jgi:hypothetical protein